MLMNAKHLDGMAIHATDGDLGTLREIYFDDQSWAVRYFVVDSGGWLEGREVLISPTACSGVEWVEKRLNVILTKAQIENSPGIEEHQPASLQNEQAYVMYQGATPIDGGISFPINPVPGADLITDDVTTNLRKTLLDAHLRSGNEISGYHIEATDGEIGHVASLIVDDQSWMVRYLEIGTRNWWPGKKVLVSPKWVSSISWDESKVAVDITRQSIQDCEEFDESSPLTRSYEERIFAHYGKPPYWIS